MAESEDILSAKNKDSINIAIIRILQRNGVNSTENISKQQDPPERKKVTRGGRAGGRVFGLSLEDGQQERRMTESEGRPCYLPRYIAWIRTCTCSVVHVGFSWKPLSFLRVT